jgi:hypothetical protein
MFDILFSCDLIEWDGDTPIPLIDFVPDSEDSDDT